MITATVVFISLFVIYIISPWVARPFLKKRFLTVIRQSGCTCLTFDDGPDPYSTPEILKLLNTFGAKATFFLIGQKVERYPDIVRQIMEMGHEIGEHSLLHKHPWKCDPFRSLVDLVRGRRTIMKFCSHGGHFFFRPPFGKLNLMTLLYILCGRRRVAFWDIDPKDYAQESSEELARFVIGRMNHGTVILLHDGRKRNPTCAEVTICGLRLILEVAVNRGLKLTTLGHAFTCCQVKKAGTDC